MRGCFVASSQPVVRRAHRSPGLLEDSGWKVGAEGQSRFPIQPEYRFPIIESWGREGRRGCMFVPVIAGAWRCLPTRILGSGDHESETAVHTCWLSGTQASARPSIPSCRPVQGTPLFPRRRGSSRCPLPTARPVHMAPKQACVRGRELRVSGEVHPAISELLRARSPKRCAHMRKCTEIVKHISGGR